VNGMKAGKIRSMSRSKATTKDCMKIVFTRALVLKKLKFYYFAFYGVA